MGVVTSDLGNGGYTVPSCPLEHGDDGVLLTRAGTMTDCAASYPRVATFTLGDDPERIPEDPSLN